jgi:4-amino-4-deoxy-L-arabinose transferase-like glycosyltransferase
VAAAFAISRAGLLFWYAPHPTDIRIYFGWIVQAAAGRAAFVDFPVEYPPLAWWVMQVPGTVDRLAYYFRFRALMAAGDIVSFALLAWIVSRRRPSLLTPFACVYIGATLILAHELYDRLDMGVLLFAAVALAAWLAARPGAKVIRTSALGQAQGVASSSHHEGPNVRESRSPNASWWLAGAYVAAGLGTAYKLFPAVVAPLFLVSELLTRTRFRSVVLRLALFVGVAVGPVVLTYWRVGRPAFTFLGYHGARGLEIGSTWASVMWLLSLAGYPVEVVIRFGSWELGGEAEAAVSGAASLSMVLVPSLLAAWALVLRRRFDGERAYAQAALALAGVVVVSKVFSPQFLLWAIPAIALAAVEGCATKLRFLAVGAWLLVCAALTLLVYEGGGSAELRIMRTWVMLALLARNVMYVSLWVYLVGALVKRDWGRLRA